MRLNRDERGLVVAEGKEVHTKKNKSGGTSTQEVWAFYTCPKIQGEVLHHDGICVEPSLPVPPKMCMSICSSRHITKVLTWGSNPKRKMTGKHKANTVGPKRKWNDSSGIRDRGHTAANNLISQSSGWKRTDEHVSDTEQEVCREKGDSIEGEGLQAARAPR